MTDAHPAYVNAYWVNDKVTLLRRDDDGTLIERRIPAEYSFFIRRQDYNRSDIKAEILLQRSKGNLVGIREEGEFVRILCRDSDFRYNVCRGKQGQNWLSAVGIDGFEADLHPVRRFLADSACGIQKPRKVWLDLETDSRVPFSRKEEARILCWALTFEDGSVCKGVLEEDTDRAERELLEDLYFELQDVDCILAWNGGDGPSSKWGFDFPLLSARLKRNKLWIEQRRWLYLDAMECFRKYNMHSAESGDEKDSVALTRVAGSLGIDTSEKTSVDAFQSWEHWKAGGASREALVRRCCFDSWSMREIEKKTGYVDLHYSVCATSGCFPDSRSLRALVHVEAFLMRLASQRQIRFPSMWGQDRQNRRKFEGAFVLAPTQIGIIRNVHVCDFSGMYPSIIQSWNMSPETWRPLLSERIKRRVAEGLTLEQVAVELPPGHSIAPKTLEVFSTTVEGILSIAVGEAKKVRKKWNKIKEQAVPNSPEWIEADRLSQGGKISVNSFFGVVSSPFSRFFVREVGESITTTGQWLIKNTMRLGEERQIKAIAGDTDSTFAIGVGEAEFREFKNECNRELYPRLLKELGCVRNEVELDYEKEFEILIIGEKKKRYCGRYRHFKGKRATIHTEPVIKGFEYKRGDSTRMTRQFQKQVIDMLLLIGKEIPDPYPLKPEDFYETINHWRELVLNGELTVRDVTVSKSLSNGPDGYEVRKKDNGEDMAQPIHVQIAKVLQERGQEVTEGTRIEYVVTSGLARPQKAVPVSDYVPGTEDRGYMWLNLVWPPVMRILEACWPKHRWERFSELPNVGGGKGRSRYLAGQNHFGFFWDS